MGRKLAHLIPWELYAAIFVGCSLLILAYLIDPGVRLDLISGAIVVVTLPVARWHYAKRTGSWL